MKLLMISRRIGRVLSSATKTNGDKTHTQQEAENDSAEQQDAGNAKRCHHDIAKRV